MPEPTAEESLELAKSHLERAQTAWYDPTDWTDLTTYGFYCLEAAVMAASDHLGLDVQRTHRGKVEGAEVLARKYKLPDVSGLLVDLNIARKSYAYGGVEAPDLSAEELASELESFVEAVEGLMSKKKKKKKR